MFLVGGVTGAGLMAEGFTALGSAVDFVTSNSILVLPIAIGLGCFAIKKAKRIFAR